MKVCRAVQFAHRHAVIHRGLEPSKILVTSDGVPRLIDFGIARLIHPEPRGDGEPLSTQVGERVSNPEYTSPEQVNGELITTASDVYSLGVVLYRLLTGLSPYRLEDVSTSELLQAICEQVPERPSTAVVRRPVPRMDSTTPMPSAPSAPTPEEIAEARNVSPARLKRILSSDLDAIVLMALRKEPESRYASADQLAEDLKGYLEGPPIGPRTAKSVRRRAAAVTAAVVLILSLVAGIAGTTRGLFLARRERDCAEESSREARRAFDQFFTRVDEDRLLHQPGLQALRKTLLEDAQRFYQEVIDHHGGDPGIAAEVATACARDARITGEIGSSARALPKFEQAIALWEGLCAAQPGNSDYSQGLAPPSATWARC